MREIIKKRLFFCEISLVVCINFLCSGCLATCELHSLCEEWVAVPVRGYMLCCHSVVNVPSHEDTSTYSV